MKTYVLSLAIITMSLTGCATIHDLSAPKNETTQKNETKVKDQHAKLASQASEWLGEPVTIESVDKGFIQTDFIAVTQAGKKISCFYTGYFGMKISSIVCGGRSNALLDAANSK